MTAAGNVSIAAVRQQHNQQVVQKSSYTEERHTKDNDWTATIETITKTNSRLTDFKGAKLSGNSVVINAGKDITAQAAELNSNNELNLDAQGKCQFNRCNWT